MNRNAKLLVVDDEATIRSFLVRVLQREGYEVHSAADGREALDRLESESFDLLLTDIRMEQLDGVSLLNRARERYPDLAVILFTGHATIDSAVEALRRGAYDYLLKPVKNEDILTTVAGALADRVKQQRRDRLEAIAGEMLQVMGDEEAPPHHSDRVVACGDLRLDTSAYIASLSGQRLDLTPTEFRLLTELTREPGAAFDYVKLVQAACGYTCSRGEAREIIGTHVLNLRSKLNIDAGKTYYVESVRGIGYRLIPPDERI